MESNEVEVFYEGELVTRREAVEKELKNYFTGKPCKHGHIAQRITGSGSCVQCGIIATKNWRDTAQNKGRNKEYQHKATPPVDDICRVLDYDAETGLFTWKPRPEEDFPSYRIYKSWNGRYAGKVAGARHYSNGYIELRFTDKKLYKAHRLAWKIMTGTDAEGLVDHKNNIPWDNRWDNLREASHRDNSRNMQIRADKKYKGITKTKTGAWRVTINVNDTPEIVGEYSKDYLAAKAYDKRAKELFGEFANLNFPEIKEEDEDGEF